MNDIGENINKSQTIGHNSDIKTNFHKVLVDCIKNLDLNLEKIVMKQKSSHLQDFYGNIGDFPVWFNEYERTTSEKSISNSENLSRLQKYLKERAKEAVKDLFYSPKNVPTIIETLGM
ncbi:hypothetical protein JTB14_037192 [Gonioctena quinquepunctata]|nr:hypothetical protein JTB14_037192 [Gonioctena quinquepunctata]